MRSGVTLCGIGSERERKWIITIEQALAWAVSADEVETNPSPLIRSPVVIIKDGHFIHGQVAACNGEGAVLLDRILGTNGAIATNDVQQIMHGIIDDVMSASADEIVTWINPLSGQEEVAFPVQHAVDYAFYKDGGVEPTPDSVGASFCTPPTASNQRQVTETTRTARRISLLNPIRVSTRTAASAMFDTQDDDDDVLEEIEVGHPTDGPNHEVQQFVPPPTKRARTTLSVAQQQHTGEILAALASQPRLQRIFAENYLPDSSVVASTSTQAPITSTTTLGSSGMRLNSAQGEAGPNFNVRNASVPTSSQFQVHEALHRTIKVRLRDILFGKRGLSVMHFQPPAFDDKVTWYMNGGSNFRNLGSSTAIPKAPQPKDVHEVVAACQTLELFASDYFSADLKASITALVAQAIGLARSHVWEADNLPLLVYWINVTLEKYRTQISQATLVPSEFKKKFSLENSSLQHIQQTVSSRQLQRLRNEITQSSRAPKRGQEQLNNDSAAKQVAPTDERSGEANSATRRHTAIPSTQNADIQLASSSVQVNIKSQLLGEPSHPQTYPLVPPSNTAGHSKSQLLSKPPRSDLNTLVPPLVNAVAGQPFTSPSTTHYHAADY
ncbi:unnamed protein product [Phytophthora fragariaefolia]|uniref:Unnamed protein product n=1 Tax=Phytophthora fragariaefolia TaxID=1490495 RepID=A0A9W6XIJ2_9STRA|nr:unnamed protein product [Phytophthora fragariaefolia]